MKGQLEHLSITLYPFLWQSTELKQSKMASKFSSHRSGWKEAYLAFLISAQ